MDPLEGTGVDTSLAEEDPEVQEALESGRTGRIRTVAPLRDEDLDVVPPPKRSYRRSLLTRIKELWRYRETMFTLTERDIRVRYKQAALGAAWAILNPLVTMVLFTIVFGRIARIVPAGGVPYPIFSYVVLVPWTLFAGTVGSGASAVIANAPIIRKVYCPREAFPIAGGMSSLFDFGISAIILLGMLVAYGFYPSITWLAAPLLLMILVVFAIALALLVSIVTVFYRDTRYGIPLLLQFLLFATPVAYPIEKVIAPNSGFAPIVKKLYVYANPLTPVMDGFRRTLLYHRWPDPGPTMVAAGVSVVLLFVALWVFRRGDAVISDIV